MKCIDIYFAQAMFKLVFILLLQPEYKQTYSKGNEDLLNVFNNVSHHA